MITVELKTAEKKLTFNPASIEIPAPGLNENLQHQEQSVSISAIYDPELLKLTATERDITVTVRDDYTTIFTGRLSNNQSWQDNGRPTPIEKLSLSVSDNTYLLDRKTENIIALKNTTLAAVITRLCQDCNVTIAYPETLPQISMEFFVMEAGKKYKDVLDSVLIQHCYAYAFDGPGNLIIFDLNAELAKEPTPITESDLLTGVSVSQTTKDFSGAKVTYNPLIKKTNEQVYFEGNSLGTENTVTPITLRGGQYYPYDSDPVQEEREGQVFQTFASGYAESYTTYSGETKYQRSEKTTLLYTENHSLVKDWDEGIQVDRTQFEATRSSVRFRNTTDGDRTLMQLAIRADAWYRNGDASVTSGDTSGSLYETDAEFIFTAEKAEKLAKLCSRFFCGRTFKISARLNQPVIPGGNYSIDTGSSGTQFTALAISCTYDPDKAIYSATFLSYGDILVDTTRFKETASGNPLDSVISEISNKLEGVISGQPEMGPPSPPKTLNAVAQEKGIQLSCVPEIVGVRNSLTAFKWEINKGNGWEQRESAEPSYFWQFDRSTDGYPEAADFATWRVRCYVISIYGKNSEYTPEQNINTDQYGTWIPPNISTLTAKASQNSIDITAAVTVPSNVYGAPFRYEFGYSSNGSSYKTETTEISSPQWFFDRDVEGYPEKSDLADYRIRCRLVSAVSGKTSASYKTATVNTSDYLTWIPSIPEVRTTASGRTAVLEFTRGDFYGFAGYRLQISQNGSTWYKPGDSADAYTNESAWRDTQNGYAQTTNAQYTQVLPLAGQARGLPTDTTYIYRALCVVAVPTTSSPNAVRVSSYSAGAAVLARATSAADIVAGAIGESQLANSSVTADKIPDGTITGEKLVAKTITTENLSVLAFNKVNSFMDGTKEGWNTAGVIVDDEELGIPVLELSAPPSFTTNKFEVLPDAIYEVKFGLQCPNYTTGSGLYFGINISGRTKRYIYDFSEKKWVYNAERTNLYFVDDYRDKTKKFFTTYLLGYNADISDCPAPLYTDETYTVCALQLTGTDTQTYLQSGYNATTAGTKWRIITPQVYQIGSGKIVANQVLCNDLTAIAGKFGYIDTERIELNATNWLTSTATNITQKDGSVYKAKAGEVCIGTTTKTSGYADSDEFFHYIPGSGFFFKIAAFIVTSIASILSGIFRVKAKGAADANSVFIVNPTTAPDSTTGTPAESVRIRGGQYNMLELKRKDSNGSSVKFSNSSRKLGVAGFTSGGNFVVDGTDDADGSGNMLKIDQSGNQTVTGSEVVNKDLTVKGDADVSGDFSACRNYVRVLSSLPGNACSVTNGHYVLLLGKILNPSSTGINSPYNWDISADFAFIRHAGHNVAFFSVKAGHGYSHNWKTYINIMVDANYNTSLFNPVTCLYNGVYWLAVQFSLTNEYYERKAFIKVARNLDELSLTVLAYKHGSTIDNSEINGSIANVPSGWKVSSLFKQNISVSGNISASGALDVTGDAAIDGDINVEGTVNHIDITAKTTGNVGLGPNALTAPTTGKDNTGVGYNALALTNTGSGNTALGQMALYANKSGNNNTAVGYNNLKANVGGQDNTAVGYNNLKANTSGNYNIAVGRNCIAKNVSGNNNIAIGDEALAKNVSGEHNIAIGQIALYNTTGNYNVGIGRNALWTNTSGDHNIAFGFNSGCIKPTYDNQVNIGNRLRYIEFAASATQATVFDTMKLYYTESNGDTGAMGTFNDREITRVQRVNRTTIYFVSNDNTIPLSCTTGSASTLGYPLRIWIPDVTNDVPKTNK